MITDSYSWCATSTDASGNYANWAYCGWGNSTSGENCVPMVKMKYLFLINTIMWRLFRSTEEWSMMAARNSPPVVGVQPHPMRTVLPIALGDTALRLTGPQSPPTPWRRRRRRPLALTPATETPRSMLSIVFP